MKYDSKLYRALLELMTTEDSNIIEKLDKEIRLSKDWDFEDDDEIEKVKDKQRIASFNYLYNKYGNVLKAKVKEPVKEKGPSKKQESAIKKLEKLKDDKIISSTDFKTVKKAILKNRSAKIYAEKLVFEFKGLKNKGTGLDSDLVVKCGKGLYGDDDSSSSSNEDLVNFEDLSDISTRILKRCNEEDEPKKVIELSKKQESAIKKLNILKETVSMSSSQYNKIADAINKNKGVMVYAFVKKEEEEEELVFEFKSSKKIDLFL